MEGHTATARCPNCAAACETTVPAPPPPSWPRWRRPEPEDLTCPACGWEFVSSAVGTIEDDGGADTDGCYDIADGGELTTELGAEIRCPGCARELDVGGEPGPVRCGFCRRSAVLLWSERRGRCVPYTPGRSPDWLPDPEPEGEWDFDPYDEGDEDDPDEHDCPTGCNGDGYGADLYPLADGFVICRECETVFRDPVLAAELAEQYTRRPAARQVRAAPGGFRALADALDRTAPGGVVRVAPGHYHWPDAGSVSDGVTVVRDGPPGSVVVNGDAAIAGTRVRAVGLAFVGRVTVQHAAVHFEQCEFAGGLVASGVRSDVWVRRCRVRGDGVRVENAGAVRLLCTSVAGCRADGVKVSSGGWAQLVRCRVSGNAEAGAVSDHPCRLFLRACRVFENGAGGVVVRGRSVVSGCRLERNGEADLIADAGCRLVVRRTRLGGEIQRQPGADVRGRGRQM